MRHSAMSDKPRRPRPVFGFLVDRIDDSYQSRLMAALVEASVEVGVTLLCFCAGPAFSREGQRHRHHAFHLASARTLDALLLSTPTLVSSLGQEELERQLARFKGRPVVSIGAELDGVASIVLDNQEGIQRVVEHLIAKHECRRIAFVRGPNTNIEAQQRYLGYAAALREAGLGLAPELVIEGDFQPDAGHQAVATLLDERQVDFDALVVSNDEMAVAAIHALQARGVRIPQDVKVTGFDDDIAAQHELPSLTTLRQSIRELALEALQLALTGQEIDISERRHVRRTELVVRRSCGCPLEREQFGVSAPKRPEHGETEAPLIQKRPELLTQMHAVGPGLVSQEHCELLLDGFFAGLMNRSMTAFVEGWDEVLRDALEQDHELKRYQEVTTALRRGAVPALIEFPGMLLRAETMLHEARVLLANVIHQKATQRQFRERRLTSSLCDVAQSLIVASDTVQLADTLTPHLRELDIPSCCLATYEPCFVAGAKNHLRVLLWYKDSQVVAPTLNGEVCYESELISDAFLRQRTSVVLPLCFGDKKLGLVIFEVGRRDGTIYEALRAQISAALEALLHGAMGDDRQGERDAMVERAALQLEQLRLRLEEETGTNVGQGVNVAASLEVPLTELSRTLARLLELRSQPNTLRPLSGRSPNQSGVRAAAVEGATEVVGD